MENKIDKEKASKVSEPFKKNEGNWLSNAIDSVKEFFVPEGPSYEERVSQGLKDFKQQKTGVESLPPPTMTPTPTPVPTATPVGMNDERMQKALAKKYMLASLGLDYEPTEEDFIIEEQVEEPKKLIPWNTDSEEVAENEEDDDFIDIDELEV